MKNMFKKLISKIKKDNNLTLKEKFDLEDSFEKFISSVVKRLRKFNKSGISNKDIANNVSDIAVYFHKRHTTCDKNCNCGRTCHMYVDKNDKISQETIDDMSVLHEEIIQKVIDFVNSHKDLSDHLKETKIHLDEDTKDYKWVTNDIRFSIGADGLDESIEHKRWVPATDSSMTLYIGRESVISIC